MDVDKATYEAKLKDLESAFAAGNAREKEASFRPDYIAELEKAIDKYSSFAASQSEDYAHISTEEKQKVASECATAQAWMTETQTKIESMKKTEEPPVKASEISAKASSLASVCQPIMATPKPAPVLPDPPPAAETEAAPAADGASAEVPEGEAAAETPAEGATKP